MKKRKFIFVQLTVQEKGPKDFRAFVYYKEKLKSDTLEIRGYGETALKAAGQGMSRYFEEESLVVEECS